MDPSPNRCACAWASTPLGKSAYQAAVDHAATMSYDDACKYVLGELDRLLGELDTGVE